MAVRKILKCGSSSGIREECKLQKYRNMFFFRKNCNTLQVAYFIFLFLLLREQKAISPQDLFITPANTTVSKCNSSLWVLDQGGST